MKVKDIMSKNVIKWGNWTELEKALGIKSKAVPAQNSAKKKTQIEKFAKCKSCGGQMTYIKGTNALICTCEIEKEKEKVVTNPDGSVTKTKYNVKEPCGNLNLVSDEYQSYMNYLFN